MNVRRIYIGIVRLIRRLLRGVGLLAPMERSRLPLVRHLRSMLAIYDTEDMAHLGLPWWTYAAIQEVDVLLEGRKARVFEYGAGASTMWLASRAHEVFSVEHDADFVPVVASLTDDFDNVTLLSVPPTEVAGVPVTPSGRDGYENADFTDYVQAIDRVGGTFDLIVVDGRARVACLDHALGFLAEGGVVLFDDIRRARYRAALERDDVEVTLLAGAKPSIPYRDTTALLRPRHGRA